jgi:hypothetical protein
MICRSSLVWLILCSHLCVPFPSVPMNIVFADGMGTTRKADLAAIKGEPENISLYT